jgi:methionyl-tRNA formyltransferase
VNISILCSDSSHPIFPCLEDWAASHSGSHNVSLVTRGAALNGGDILFLISCHEIIARSVRESYRKTLVIHASDLPRGRGWSPHIWAVLATEKRIVVSLIEAADSPDRGPIWHKTSFELEGHELYDEMNAKLFQAEINLMDFALQNFGTVTPMPQAEIGATYYRQRRPEDSKIDINSPIATQLALLRVCDPNRYPAYFEKDGYIYEILLRKRASKQN